MHLEILDYVQKNWRNKAVTARLGYEERVPQHKYHFVLCVNNFRSFLKSEVRDRSP